MPFRLQLFQDIPLVYLSFDDEAPRVAAVDTATPLVVQDRLRNGAAKDRTVRLLEPLECTADAQCDAPLSSCDNNFCVPPAVRCLSDASCTGDDVCFRGACVTSSVECTADAGCSGKGRRSTCAGGRCVLLNPRFIFRNLQTYDLPLSPVGLQSGSGATLSGQTTALGAVLGASLLRNFAVRLAYLGSSPRMTLLDEIPDTHEQLSDDCDHDGLPEQADPGCAGVFGARPQGGGLLETADGTATLPPTRLVLGVCLVPEVFDRSKADPSLPPAQQQHGAATISGVPAEAVVSTGLGVTVVSATLADRLRARLGGTVSERAGTLSLPGGSAAVTLLDLPRLALVSGETRELGPCGELALRRRLLLAGTVGLTAEDQALLDDKKINGASAALLAARVEVAVLADESDLLQGLRQELRPATASIDAVLGGDVLKAFEVELDYPASRVILRCAEQTTAQGTCEVLPFCAHPSNSGQEAIRCPQAKQ